MCGRFVLTDPAEALTELFGLPMPPDAAPRFNIAPTQRVLAVRGPEQPGGPPRLEWMRWGWVPRWAKEGRAAPLINARAETAGQKPTFRHALAGRRCVVPADGFYEWKREGTTKQPFLLRLAGGEPFALAALWDRLPEPVDGIEVAVCLLTTAANARLEPIHDRMPVILPRGELAAWLGPAAPETAQLEKWLRPYPADAMEALAVSPRVGSSKVDDPELVRPVT